MLAAAVFDSTAFDAEPPLDILWLPGMVFVYPPDAGDEVQGKVSAAPWRSLLQVH